MSDVPSAPATGADASPTQDTPSVARNIGALRRELAGLRTKVELDQQSLSRKLSDEISQVRSLAEGLEPLEAQFKELKAAFAREARERTAAKGGHTALVERIAALEARSSSKSQVVEMQDRLNYVEQLMGDAAEKTAESLASTRTQISELQGTSGQRIAALEASMSNLAERHAARADASKGKQGLPTHPDHAFTAMAGRMDTLEAQVRESFESSASELHGLRASLDRHGDAQAKHSRELEAVKRASESHATLAARFESLERELGTSANRHASDLERLRSAHAKHGDAQERHAQELDGLKAEWAGLPALAERLAGVEQSLGECIRRHGADLEAVRAVGGRTAKDLEALRFAQNAHPAASIAERLEHMERAYGQQHGVLLERVDHVERLLVASEGRQAQGVDAANARIQELHSKMAVQQSVRDAQVGDVRHALAADTVSGAGQSSQQQMLRDLSSAAGEAAERQKRSLQTVRDSQESTLARIQSLEDRLAEERNARDTHWGALQKALADETRAAADRQSSAQKSLREIQTAAAEAADRHQQSFKALAEQIRELEEKLQSDSSTKLADAQQLREHIQVLERKLQGDSSAKLTDVQQLRDRVAACEVQAHELGAGHDELESAFNALEAELAQLRENAERTEAAFQNSAEQHGSALEAAKSASGRLAADAKAREAVLAERLAGFEKHAADAQHQNGEDYLQVRSKLEQAIGRLGHCETLCSGFADMRAGQAALANDVVALTSQCSRVGERVAELESAIGAERARHMKQAGALESAQGKLDKLQNRMAVGESNIETLGEIVKAHGSPTSNRATVSDIVTTLTKRCDDFDQIMSSLAALETAKVQQLEATHLLSDDLAGVRTLVDAKAERADVAAQYARDVGVLQGQIASLEKAAQEVTGVQSKLENSLAQEQAARQRLAATLQGGLSDQQAALEQRAAGDQASQHVLDEFREQLRAERLLREELERQVKEQRASVENQEATLRQLAVEHRDAVDSRDRGGPAEGRVDARLRSLHLSVTTAEGLLRREMEDRVKEERRLWDALDSQARDLASQINEPPPLSQVSRSSALRAGRAPAADDQDDAEGAFLPFPCQPLTSFLRIGAHGLSADDVPARIGRGIAGRK